MLWGLSGPFRLGFTTAPVLAGRVEVSWFFGWGEMQFFLISFSTSSLQEIPAAAIQL